MTTMEPAEIQHVIEEHTIPREAAEEGVTPAEPRPFKRAIRSFTHNPVGMFALGFIVFLVLVAIFAPALAPYDQAEFTGAPYQGVSSEHWFGTDELGRDTLSRLIFGAQVSMRAGLQTVLMALVIAVPLGLFSGYVGGKFDTFLMRVMDGIMSFPAIVLALVIAAVLGQGLGNAMIAITIVLVPSFVRLLRGQALAVSQENYVEASRSIGTPRRTILRKRVFPGVTSVLIVQATLFVGVAIIAEAALGFIGLGVIPPEASWGSMLQRSFSVVRTHPFQMIVPGVAIGLTVLAFNTFGDALRDSLGLSDTPTGSKVKRGKLGITSVDDRPLADPPNAGAPATDALLSVQGLSVEFATTRGVVTVVDDVSFDVNPGEIVGLVGESGCGKSVTSLSILRLIPTPPGRVASGRILFEGRDLMSLGFKELRDIRGTDIAMVFQDPMSSLDPAFTIGNQMVEAMQLHRSIRKADARTRAAELLDLVGIPDPMARLEEYPHRLSGGMRQRVLIAMGLANDPKLLIADEPTTAVDVTVEAQILELLKRLQRDLGMSMIFVTHDLGVVADICDRVVVMYAGQVIEQAPVDDLFARPSHPYTQALLAAMPPEVKSDADLASIPGRVPSPGSWPVGCRFASRCGFAADRCSDVAVELKLSAELRNVRCARHGEFVLSGAPPSDAGPDQSLP